MSLKKATVKGVAWNSLGTVGAGFVNILITVILARLLTPRDFGILELLVVFSVLSNVFVDAGFSQAVIRDNNTTNKDLTSVFYTNLIVAFCIYVILFSCSTYIADFYNEPILKSLSQFVFLTIIFNSLSLIQNANFSKDINFKAPALSSILAMIIAGGTAIVMAFRGFGVWALAINLVLYSFLKTIFLWFQSSWRPKGWIHISSLKKYFSFSSNLLLQGLADKIVTNLEPLLIGKVYSKADLGFFSQGRKLNSYITQTSTGVIQRVTYPVLSKLGDDKRRLKAGYKQIIGITMLVIIPTMFGVVASSDNLIVVVFGQKWLSASPYLSLWAITGLFVSLYSFFINIFLVLGRSRQLLYISLFRQVVRLIAIIFLIRISIIALMLGIVIVTFFSSIFYIYYGGKLINYRISELLRDLWQIIFVSLLSAFIIYEIGNILMDYNVYLRFTIQVFVMLSFSYFLLRSMKNVYLKELQSLIISFLTRK